MPAVAVWRRARSQQTCCCLIMCSKRAHASCASPSTLEQPLLSAWSGCLSRSCTLCLLLMPASHVSCVQRHLEKLSCCNRHSAVMLLMAIATTRLVPSWLQREQAQSIQVLLRTIIELMPSRRHITFPCACGQPISPSVHGRIRRRCAVRLAGHA